MLSYHLHSEVPQTLPQIQPQPQEQHAQAPQGQDKARQEAGSKAYEESMKEHHKNSAGVLMDGKLSDADYYKKMQEEEKRYAEELKKMLKENGANLSELQKSEANSYLKYNEYKENYAKISQDYHANKNDPEAKAKYEEIQKEFKKFREAVENSPQYKDNQHIKKSKELGEQLEKAKTDDEKAAIKSQIAHEYREFARDNAKDKDSQAKFVEFAEQNKDNAFIQKSGLYNMAQDIKQRNHLESKTEEKKEEKTAALGDMKVTPATAAQAGAVSGVEKSIVDQQIAANVANDNGKVARQERLESQEHSKADLPVPTQVSGPAQSSRAGASL